MFSLHICSSTTLPGPRWLPFDNFHCRAERGACSGPLGPRHTQPAAGPVPGHHNVLLRVRSAAEPEGLHNKLLFVCFVVVWSRSLSDGWPTLQSRGGEGGRGGGQGAMPAEPSERPRALKAAFVSPGPPPPRACLGRSVTQSRYCLLGKGYGILLQLFMKENIWCFCGKWVGRLNLPLFLFWKLYFFLLFFLASSCRVFLSGTVHMPSIWAAVKVLLLKQTRRPPFGAVNKDTQELLLGICLRSFVLLSSVFCSGSIWKC